MSKNVNSTAFRKIDVDQYNDDFKDDENATEIPSLSKSTFHVPDGILFIISPLDLKRVHFLFDDRQRQQFRGRTRSESADSIWQHNRCFAVFSSLEIRSSFSF